MQHTVAIMKGREGLVDRLLLIAIVTLSQILIVLQIAIYNLYVSNVHTNYVVKTTEGTYQIQNIGTTPHKIDSTEYDEITQQSKYVEWKNQNLILNTPEDATIQDSNMNRVQVIGDNVYFFKTYDGKVTVNKFDQQTFRFEEIYTVENSDNLEQIGYYSVVDAVDGMEDKISELVNSSKGTIDNTVYQAGYLFIQIKTTNDKLNLYVYDSNHKEFKLIAKFNNESLLEVYKVESVKDSQKNT